MKYNLSEINDLIRDRRTIYPEQFSTRKVHKEQIELLLNNAIWAPSHNNMQPWKFVVLMDEALPKLSQKLGELYLKITPNESQNDMKLAKLMTRPNRSSAVVAIVLNRSQESKISELDETMAVAAAVQNMHLTATAYGIGAFWATPKVIFEKEMNEFLGINMEDKCLGLFYLGYPAEEWPKSRRRPIEYCTTWINE